MFEMIPFRERLQLNLIKTLDARFGLVLPAHTPNHGESDLANNQ